MSGELLHPGDEPRHVCDLPRVDKVNAVARCGECGALYVSRTDPDAWGDHPAWVPLRWWHRRARRNLRATR